MENTTNANRTNAGNQADRFREMLTRITNFCTDKLVEYQTDEDWEDNHNNISWAIPETDQVARLALEPLSARDNLYHVTIGVRQINSDRLRSHYLKKGSREELVEYLKKPETRATLMDSILELYKDE